MKKIHLFEYLNYLNLAGNYAHSCNWMKNWSFLLISIRRIKLHGNCGTRWSISSMLNLSSLREIIGYEPQVVGTNKLFTTLYRCRDLFTSTCDLCYELVIQLLTDQYYLYAWYWSVHTHCVLYSSVVYFKSVLYRKLATRLCIVINIYCTWMIFTMHIIKLMFLK